MYDRFYFNATVTADVTVKHVATTTARKALAAKLILLVYLTVSDLLQVETAHTNIRIT